MINIFKPSTPISINLISFHPRIVSWRKPSGDCRPMAISVRQFYFLVVPTVLSSPHQISFYRVETTLRATHVDIWCTCIVSPSYFFCLYVDVLHSFECLNSNQERSVLVIRQGWPRECSGSALRQPTGSKQSVHTTSIIHNSFRVRLRRHASDCYSIWVYCAILPLIPLPHTVSHLTGVNIDVHELSLISILTADPNRA